MKLRMTKDRLGALRPADDQSKEALSKIAPGEYCTVELTRPRNAQFHKLFFALISVVHHNMNDDQQMKWPTVERLLFELKLQTGYFDMHESIGGKFCPVTHSISFAQMDETSFAVFFDKAIDVCRKYFLPGVADRELRDAVDAQLRDYLEH